MLSKKRVIKAKVEWQFCLIFLQLNINIYIHFPTVMLFLKIFIHIIYQFIQNFIKKGCLTSNLQLHTWDKKYYCVYYPYSIKFEWVKKIKVSQKKILLFQFWSYFLQIVHLVCPDILVLMSVHYFLKIFTPRRVKFFFATKY